MIAIDKKLYAERVVEEGEDVISEVYRVYFDPESERFVAKHDTIAAHPRMPKSVTGDSLQELRDALKAAADKAAKPPVWEKRIYVDTERADIEGNCISRVWTNDDVVVFCGDSGEFPDAPPPSASRKPKRLLTKYDILLPYTDEGWEALTAARETYLNVLARGDAKLRVLAKVWVDHDDPATVIASVLLDELPTFAEAAIEEVGKGVRHIDRGAR